MSWNATARVVLFLALLTVPYSAASGTLSLLLLFSYSGFPYAVVLQVLSLLFVCTGLFPRALWGWLSGTTDSLLHPGHHPPNHPPNPRPGFKWDQYLPIPRDVVFEAELSTSDNIIAMLEERLHHTAGNMKDLNSSQLLPLLPVDIAWMIDYTERRMGRFNADVTQTMARLTSVSYCEFQNVAAWNCTRYTIFGLGV